MALQPSTRRGQFVPVSLGGERYATFEPPLLPPVPPLDLAPLQRKLDRANQAVGRLDGLTALLPDTELFLYLYVRKEALLSSQIEGTQSSLSDLLLHENNQMPGVPLEDVEEVSNYVAAMTHGLTRIREQFPLSLRLLREMHAVLLRGGRGASKQPGEFRTSQNWIGGSRPGNAAFVPPPPQRLPDLLSNLERFLHDESQELPVLVKAAIAHVQFETIHPFLDGNGRLGRLLITLLICVEGILEQPILYLSLYFKTWRDRYYQLLQRVRTDGDWEEWIAFFLEGVAETAEQAALAARRILELFAADRSQIATLGRRASSALRVHDALQRSPYLTIATAADTLKLSIPTVASAVGQLVQLGILQELTGRQRDRLFLYAGYMDILSVGTEPLARN